MAPSEQTAVSATMVSFIALLLTRRGRREDVAAVGIGHALAEAVVRCVLRPETFHDDLGADLEGVLGDPAPHQLTRRAAGECPVRHAAVRVLDVDIEPDMRVLPFDL